MSDFDLCSCALSGRGAPAVYRPRLLFVSWMAAAGTVRISRSFLPMAEPLPILVENAIQIAWDFLERSGELGDPREASQFLLKSIGATVRRGERRRLRLSNKAIDEYKRYKTEQLAA